MFRRLPCAFFSSVLLAACSLSCSRSEPPVAEAAVAESEAPSDERVAAGDGEDTNPANTVRDEDAEWRDLYARCERGEREACQASVDSFTELQMEKMGAKQRELLARCERGDRKACAEAICMNLAIDGESEPGWRKCAIARKFRTADLWVQMSELTVDHRGSRKVRVVCMHEPATYESTEIFGQLTLVAGPDYFGGHGRDRFYIENVVGGADFATWEEAADGFCGARTGE